MPLPSRPLGNPFGAIAHPKVLVECYVDFCCPFSKKIYDTLTLNIIPHFIRRDPDSLKVVFHQVPQPWHPQSAMMHEAALAVEISKPSAYPAMFAKLMDKRDDFTGAYSLQAFHWTESTVTECRGAADIMTYEKSRLEIYEQLSEIAAEVGVEHDPFMKLLVVFACIAFRPNEYEAILTFFAVCMILERIWLQLDASNGKRNGANGTTQALKHVIKHHRQVSGVGFGLHRLYAYIGHGIPYHARSEAFTSLRHALSMGLYAIHRAAGV